MRRLLPLASLFLACGAAAQVGTATYYPPTEWPALEQIAQKVPAFAGFTVSQQQGKFVVLPALTDPRQETALRSALNADPYWKKRLTGWSMGQGIIRMKTPVSRLLEVVRDVQKERPNATLRIDTAFGKVRLNAPDAFTRTLAAKLGVVGLLVNNEWKPPLTVSYDVQPRTVKLSQLEKKPVFRALPELRILITNTGDEVVAVGSASCNRRVTVVTATGQQTPPLINGCTQEAGSTLVRPGETFTLTASPWNDLRKLTPGRYAWVYEGQKFPFEVVK